MGRVLPPWGGGQPGFGTAPPKVALRSANTVFDFSQERVDFPVLTQAGPRGPSRGGRGCGCPGGGEDVTAGLTAVRVEEIPCAQPAFPAVQQRWDRR